MNFLFHDGDRDSMQAAAVEESIARRLFSEIGLELHPNGGECDAAKLCAIAGFFVIEEENELFSIASEVGELAKNASSDVIYYEPI